MRKLANGLLIILVVLIAGVCLAQTPEPQATPAKAEQAPNLEVLKLQIELYQTQLGKIEAELANMRLTYPVKQKEYEEIQKKLEAAIVKAKELIKKAP